MPEPREPESDRPIPVGGEPPETEAPAGVAHRAEDSAEIAPGLPGGESQPGEEGLPGEPIPELVERPGAELLVGIVAAFLAISVFFPWYESAGPVFGLGKPSGSVFKVSGWASGTWGPLTFFLALAAVAIVALRRARVPLSFPIEHTMILEGVGWIAVIGILIKRLRPVTLPSQLGGATLGSSKGIFVALGAAILLALLAGRLSTGAPFVLRPGWLRAPGGTVVAAILIVALGAGLAFGLTNEAAKVKPPPAAATPTPGPTPTIGMPRCARALDFPILKRAKLLGGFEPPGGTGYCVVQLSTKLSVRDAYDGYKTALRKAGWSYEKAQPQSSSARALSLTKPQCGTLSVVGGKGTKTRTIQAYFQDCSRVSPTPTQTASS